MLKKLGLLMIFVFLLTGCTAKPQGLADITSFRIVELEVKETIGPSDLEHLASVIVEGKYKELASYEFTAKAEVQKLLLLIDGLREPGKEAERTIGFNYVYELVVPGQDENLRYIFAYNKEIFRFFIIDRAAVSATQYEASKEVVEKSIEPLLRDKVYENILSGK